ncbi:MAG TPA: hypothetical protein VF373_10640 [Prolixibacteraceae bacterium]
MILFRPKLNVLVEYDLTADDFIVSNPTQGDTPSSFAVRLSSRRSPGLD